MSIRISTTIKQLSATASEAQARTHTCRIDRPAAKGGTDLGPMGGELLLMGIGGCFMSNLLAAVAEAGLAIDDLTVTVSASLETNPPRFSDIQLAVATTNPARDQLPALIEKAEAACIAVNTTKAATQIAVSLA